MTAFTTWQAVQHLPLGGIAGAEVAFADWPVRARYAVEDSLAKGVELGCVDPRWKEADLQATVKRVGEAWELRATWSPPAVP